MNEKRYYWLKLEENYFDLKVQKALRKLPSGADMLICYLKMQLKYLNTGGIIEFNNICQSIAEEIALDIDEEIDLVNMTLAILTKWNVIEVEEENLFIAEMQNRIGSKTDTAIRVAKHREKQKMLHCNTNETKCNSIKDIDIEKDIDIDNIYSQVEVELGMTLSPINFEKINYLIETYGEDKFKEALATTSNANKKSLNYLEGVLKNKNYKRVNKEPEWLGKEIKNEKSELSYEGRKFMEEVLEGIEANKSNI